MAERAINVVIKGQYTDKDVKKAITDLRSLETQATKTKAHAKGLGGEMGKLGASYKQAFMGLGAAAVGAFGASKVLEFFQSSVEAAMENDKALRSLTVTYRNLGIAMPVDATDQWLTKLSEATGVAKTETLPALQKLVTATGSFTQSQGALQTAMNVAAGSGGTKGLMDVVQALSKAYAGNFTAITRLNTGIDANIIASHDMSKIMAALDSKYKGQSASAADSYAGKMDRLTAATDAAKEKIGTELLKTLDDVSNKFGGVGGVTDSIDAAGTSFANFVAGVGVGVGGIVDALDWLKSHTDGAFDNTLVIDYAKSVITASNPLVGLYMKLSSMGEDAAGATQDFSAAQGQLNQYLSLGVHPLADVTDGVDGVTASADAAKSAIDRLKSAFDDLTGPGKTVRSTSIALGNDKRTIASLGETTTAGGVKRYKDAKGHWHVVKDAAGNSVMNPDAVSHARIPLNAGHTGFALGTKLGGEADSALQSFADDAIAHATAMAAAGNAAGAAKYLDTARSELAGYAGSKGIKGARSFALTRIPKSGVAPQLNELIGSQASGYGSNITPSQYTVYNFNGNLIVKDVADAVVQAQKARRLQALSAGRGNTNGGARRALGG